MQPQISTTQSICYTPGAFRTLWLMLLASLFAAPCLHGQAAEPMDHSGSHDSPPALVQAVRDATRQFLDVNVAVDAGYEPALGCVSGPDHGAMGVHFIKGSLLNGEINASTPQALIYEPLAGGRMRLVGVEFIVDAKTWNDKQKQQGIQNPAPPQLYQQLFQIVPSPNRFNLDTFFELHVWAWQDNPNGAFVDWNTNVNCNHQGRTLTTLSQD